MENQDKLYEQFKEAAGKAENKSFDRMEAVWNRVEEKLDNKKKRRSGIIWRYGSIAAVLLIMLALGGQFFKNHTAPNLPEQTPETKVTTIDREKIEETFSPTVKDTQPTEAVVINEEIQSEQNNLTDSTKNIENIKQYNKRPYERTYNNIALEESSDIQSGDVVTAKEDKFSVQNSIHFGEPKKKELKTTSIVKKSEITSIDVQGKPNSSIAQSLQGQVPGLNITTGSGEPGSDYNRSSLVQSGNSTVIRSKDAEYDVLSNGSIQYRQLPSQIAANGQPGASDTVILRGTGTINGNIEPLFVVDGIPVNEDSFKSLNANDIASVNVLKDNAATSIYGNRGANGVIIIETKSKTFKTLAGQVKGITILPKEQPETEKKAILNSITFLRGNKEPVYVVDGVIIDGKAFRNLNQNDITHINIFKDPASTARFGNRGINGVVMVTTRNNPLFTSGNKEEPDTNSEPKIFQKIQVDQEDYEMFEENAFENPAFAPLSTFSIDVDNASYTNIRRFLNNGQTVPKDAVRVEEMINFFKYSYPEPKGDVPFSINTEYSDAPWNTKHKLLKIGLKGVDIPTNKLPASNFVFLIDVSGSMDTYNKLPLLKQSMKLLVNQMRDEDKIAIVVYSGAAGMVLPPTNGSEKAAIINALDKLEAGGSTAGGVGIELAYKIAQENFIKGGNNRIILATDGDFNVGMTSNRDMETLIEEKRKSGVFLTCLGYGMGNYKDSKMEILADKGNGNYAYIDNMQEADRFLQKEFKGSMFAIAKDVKIQIEFNPKHVRSYRLIGYENRKLRDEDFVNDAIDAGELGSGHTVTALYEIIPTGVQSDYFTPAPDLKYSQTAKTTANYSDELATIKFRHKKPDGNKSKETIQIIANSPVTLQQASEDFKFAAAVAWFGLKLRDSKLVPDKSSDNIIKLAKEVLNNDPDGYRAEFVRLVEMVE